MKCLLGNGSQPRHHFPAPDVLSLPGQMASIVVQHYYLRVSSSSDNTSRERSHAGGKIYQVELPALFPAALISERTSLEVLYKVVSSRSSCVLRYVISFTRRSGERHR